MVRVTNKKSGKRSLIKELKSEVHDIAFALKNEEVILGCVDFEGTVFVYKIEEQQEIEYPLIHFVSDELHKLIGTYFLDLQVQM